MNVVIRAADEGDIEEMCRISSLAHLEYGDMIPSSHKMDFLHRYRMSQERQEQYSARMKRRLHLSQWRLYVAQLEEKIVGYTLVKMQDDVILKKGLFVHPEFQGKGYGSQLFRASIEELPRGVTVRLLVLEKNARARWLYEQYGFKVTGVNSELFYGATQVIMEKVIAS